MAVALHVAARIQFDTTISASLRCSCACAVIFPASELSLGECPVRALQEKMVLRFWLHSMCAFHLQHACDPQACVRVCLCVSHLVTHSRTETVYDQRNREVSDSEWAAHSRIGARVLDSATGAFITRASVQPGHLHLIHMHEAINIGVRARTNACRHTNKLE